MIAKNAKTLMFSIAAISILGVATTPAFAQIGFSEYITDDCDDGHWMQTNITNPTDGTLSISIDFSSTLNWQCGETNKTFQDADVYVSHGGDQCSTDFDSAHSGEMNYNCGNMDINSGEWAFVQVDAVYGTGSNTQYLEWSGWYQY